MKGKKILIGFLIFLGIIFILWIVGRITGALQFYNVPSRSMEPAIKKNTKFFSTNLKQPKRNDIIVYSRLTKESDGMRPGLPAVFMHRLIAFGGETVEIRKGLAYVNGILVDDSTKLMFQYLIKKENRLAILEGLGIDANDPENYLYGYDDPASAYFQAALSYDDYKIFRQQFDVIRDTTTYQSLSNQLYANDSSAHWTVNNYGPFKVPKDHYFVLGDNRDQSADSRYNGPIPVKNYKGKLLWQF